MMRAKFCQHCFCGGFTRKNLSKVFLYLRIHRLRKHLSRCVCQKTCLGNFLKNYRNSSVIESNFVRALPKWAQSQMVFLRKSREFPEGGLSEHLWMLLKQESNQLDGELRIFKERNFVT